MRLFGSTTLNLTHREHTLRMAGTLALIWTRGQEPAWGSSPTGRVWALGQVEAEKSLAPAGKHSPVRLRRESSQALVWHCVVPIFSTRLHHRDMDHPIPLMWIWSLMTAVSGQLAKALGGTTTCPRHVGRRSIRSRMGSITLLYLYNHVSQSRPYFCWHGLSHSTRTPADY